MTTRTSHAGSPRRPSGLLRPGFFLDRALWLVFDFRVRSSRLDSSSGKRLPIDLNHTATDRLCHLPDVMTERFPQPITREAGIMEKPDRPSLSRLLRGLHIDCQAVTKPDGEPLAPKPLLEGFGNGRAGLTANWR